MQLAYHWLSWTNEDTNFRETIDPILPEWVGSRVSISSRPIILVDWIASCVAFISIFFAHLKKTGETSGCYTNFFRNTLND